MDRPGRHQNEHFFLSLLLLLILILFQQNLLLEIFFGFFCFCWADNLLSEVNPYCKRISLVRVSSCRALYSFRIRITGSYLLFEPIPHPRKFFGWHLTHPFKGRKIELLPNHPPESISHPPPDSTKLTHHFTDFRNARGIHFKLKLDFRSNLVLKLKENVGNHSNKTRLFLACILSSLS